MTGSHLFGVLAPIYLGRIRGFTPKIPQTGDLSPPRIFYLYKKELFSTLDEGRSDEVGCLTYNEKYVMYGIIKINFYMCSEYLQY